MKHLIRLALLNALNSKQRKIGKAILVLGLGAVVIGASLTIWAAVAAYQAVTREDRIAKAERFIERIDFQTCAERSARFADPNLWISGAIITEMRTLREACLRERAPAESETQARLILKEGWQ